MGGVFFDILQLLLDPGEASCGKDDEQRGGQLARAGGDREGAGQGGQDGQGESHPQPNGKAGGLWERRRQPAQKIFNIGAPYKNDMVHSGLSGFHEWVHDLCVYQYILHIILLALPGALTLMMY